MTTYKSRLLRREPLVEVHVAAVPQNLTLVSATRCPEGLRPEPASDFEGSRPETARSLKLVFEVEDLRNDLPGFVGSTLGLKQFGHGRLPASIDLGASHPLLRNGKIIGFRVADQ